MSDYIVGEELSRTRYARVCRGTDASTGADVALKSDPRVACRGSEGAARDGSL